MFTPALLNFIRLQRKAEISEDDLYQQLVMAGWPQSTIKDAMKGVGESSQFVRGVAPEISPTAAAQAQTDVKADPSQTFETTGIFQGTAQPEINQKTILIGQTTDSLAAGTSSKPLTAAGFSPATIELSPPPSELGIQPTVDEKVTPVAAAPSEQPAKKNISALKFFLVVVFLVILLLGGVGLTAATGYLPMQWALGPALNKTMLMERGQVEFDAQLEVTEAGSTGDLGTTMGAGLSSAAMSVSMTYDTSTPDVPLIEATLRLTDPQTLSELATARVRVIGEVGYVLYQFQDPEMSAGPPTETWIEVRMSDLSQFDSTSAAAESADLTISEAEIMQLWEDNQFVVLERWLGPDNDQGLLVQRFNYRLDTDRLKQFMLAVIKQTDSSSDQELRMMGYMLEEAFLAVENPGGQVWIDLRTGLVKKLTFSVDLLDQQQATMIPAGSLQLQFFFEPMTEPLQLSPPPNPISLTELFSQQMEAMEFDPEQIDDGYPEN